MSKNKYTDEEFIEAVKNSYSIANICRLVGLKPAGGNYRTVKNNIKRLNLDTSHFTGQLWSKGKKLGSNYNGTAKPLSEILIENSNYQSYKLSKRLREEGLKLNICECCNSKEWLGKPIPLELHHANTKSTIDYVTSESKSGLSESSLMNYKADFWGNYDRHYFYAFESNNLRLIIGGWFKDGNRAAEYMYFPIPVKAIHNTHHALTAIIKGKGVKNPDDNYESSGKLETTLKVLAWNEDNKEVVFE